MTDFQITLTVAIGIIGCLGAFIWLALVVFLKVKWLTQLEDIMGDGTRFFSSSIFFAGQGTIKYAMVFLLTFHAKRCGMLEKREKVPKYIQKWFIFVFYWFLFSLVLVIGAWAALEVSGEI